MRARSKSNLTKFSARTCLFALVLVISGCNGTIIGNGIGPKDDDPGEGKDPIVSHGTVADTYDKRITTRAQLIELVLNQCANPFAHFASDDTLSIDGEFNENSFELELTSEDDGVSARMDDKTIVKFVANEDSGWSTKVLEAYTGTGAPTCGIVTGPTPVTENEVVVSDRYEVKLNTTSQEEFNMSWTTEPAKLTPIGAITVKRKGEDIPFATLNLK